MDSKILKESTPEIRTGKAVDMDAFLRDLDSDYLTSLDSTLSSYDTYDEISNETYNDYQYIGGKLHVLHELGYLNNEEYSEILKVAAEMRRKKLEELNPNEENGS